MTKRGVSIRGKFVLSRNPEYKTKGGHHVAKRSSDPRVAYPEVKVQVRDLVRAVGIVASFCSHGAQYSGVIRLIEPQGVYGRRRPVPGAQSSGTPRESQAKFRDGTVWGLYKDPVCTWPSGSVFGENSF